MNQEIRNPNIEIRNKGTQSSETLNFKGLVFGFGILNLRFISNFEFRISCLIFAFVALFASPVFAQSGLSVTLTPPMYQLSIGPGETWSSSLKIVNNNPYDVTYYAQVVDMEAKGETGQSKFIPVLNPQDPELAAAQLARWIQVTDKVPLTIKAGKSENLHFNVNIPTNAEPGGHYAAILVGTQPLAASTTGSQMRISSFVSSLLFVRVKGNVVESGRIREFTSDKNLYQTPKADFVLRFENTGNTHLRPEGEVTIYNMWGKERGNVLINQESGFGNALPKTIRKFQFSWEGEENVFDIGRYSAEVTFAYGEDGRKSISATAYFWVVPIVPVAITLGTILSFFLLLGWFIRRYIRRALALERERYGVVVATPAQVLPNVPAPQGRAPILETMIEPLREGVVDLRKVAGSLQQASQSEGQTSVWGSDLPSQGIQGPTLSYSQFVGKYRIFLMFVVVLLVCVIGIWFYMAKVLIPQRQFNIKSITSQSEVADR
jgi:hypothetical protein